MFGFLKKKKAPDEEYLADLAQRRKAAASQQNSAGAFRMTVDDVFTISGRGTVVTGRIEAGAVRVGDKILVSRQSGRLPTRVDGLEQFQKIVETAQTGDYVGVRLRGVTHDQVEKGDTLLNA